MNTSYPDHASNPAPGDPASPWAGGAYSIKRHGVTLTNCDSEPVQMPGCIQAHGAMLVVQPGDFTILQVSENVGTHFGRTPEELLGQPVATVLGEEGARWLRQVLDRELVERNPLYVFTLPAREAAPALDLTVHLVDGVAVLECEPTARAAMEPEPDYYALVKRSVGRMQSAQTLAEFCQIAAEQVRALTGLDRVMVYRFHEDFHGEVVAESRREDLSSWLGLHYPSEDIPRPAREIFKKIWLRPLPDATEPVMELVPLVNPATQRPLDMTHCALRGASVMYVEYLQNMGVAASLTLSIFIDGELWGLIACHHYTPTCFPYQVRAGCEFLAQVTSLQLRSAVQRETLHYRLRLEEVHNRIIAQAALNLDLASMTVGSPNLLDAMDATGAAMYHSDRWWRVGATPVEAHLDALKTWLDTRPEFQNPTRPVYATDSLVRDFPGAADDAAVASGLLALPLARRKGNVIIWFRPETIQTVKWGGDPSDKPIVTGPHGPRLTPRKSFELFTESVSQRALPWNPSEIDAALRLRLLIMELVVTRADRLREVNADLTRSNEELDAFAYVASHDLKEPLRGISKYAHQLLDSAVADDVEIRTRLEGLQRLTLRMDSLLDSLLHYSRVGRTTLQFEKVDLNEVVAEALEIVAARRLETPTEINVASQLPTVLADRMRVREVFANLIANALKYNDKPQRVIHIGYANDREQGTVFHVRDNGIGIEAQHQTTVFNMFKRLHGRNEFGGGSGAGLTIVEKLVSQHRGRVWFESTPGEGTTFFFTLASGADTTP
jgi:two-component system, chemotaxis family, sensor kinase Cph1